MPDKPAPLPAATLPAFAPVPRAKDRSNGWKPEVQRAFIEALAETGSVKSAARRVGRAEVGAYLLRRHPEAEEFRRAWDAALDIGMRRAQALRAQTRDWLERPPADPVIAAGPWRPGPGGTGEARNRGSAGPRAGVATSRPRRRAW